MANFLNSLVARTLGVAHVARPVIATMFAPAPTLEPDNSAGEPVGQNSEDALKSTLPVSRKKETSLDPDRPSGRAPAALPPPEASRDPHPAQCEVVFEDAARPALEGNPSLDWTKQTSAAAKLTTNTQAEPVPASGLGPRKGAASEPTTMDRTARVSSIAQRTIPQLTVQTDLRLPGKVSARTPAEAAQERAKFVPLESAYGNRSEILAQGRSSSREQTHRAPIVRVTIGRVEVRAEFSNRGASQADAEEIRPATLALEEYLRQRKEGKR
jgi:hypothetical protein